MDKVLLFKDNSKFKCSINKSPIDSFNSLEELDSFTSHFFNEAQLLNYYYNVKCSIDLEKEDHKIDDHFLIVLNQEYNKKTIFGIIYKNMLPYLDYDLLEDKIYEYKKYDKFRWMCTTTESKDIGAPSRAMKVFTEGFDDDKNIINYELVRDFALRVYDFEKELNKVDIKPKHYYKKRNPWK